jgi:hypothetical protein
VLRRTGKRLALQCVSFPPSLVIDCPPMMFRNYSSKIAQQADSFKDCSKVAKNAGSARISWVSGFPTVPAVAKSVREFIRRSPNHPSIYRMRLPQHREFAIVEP